MNDDLEQGECGADSISMEGEGRGSGEETVHKVIRIRGETDEEQELWALFDGA